jgi:hypothetical protein
MPTYKVGLSRNYIVEIKAKNENDAREFTEFFLDDIKDSSTKEDRKKFGFEFLNIEPTINEAFEYSEDEDNE